MQKTFVFAAIGLCIACGNQLSDTDEPTSMDASDARPPIVEQTPPIRDAGDIDDVDGAAPLAQDAGSDARSDAPDAAGVDGPAIDADSGRPIRVLDVGESCDDNSSCSGYLPSCVPELGGGEAPLVLPSGYCSAVCETSIDCGPSGSCVRAEAEQALQGTPGAAFAPSFPQYCLKSCATDTDCREDEGYACRPMTVLFPEALQETVANAIDGSTLASARLCLP